MTENPHGVGCHCSEDAAMDALAALCAANHGIYEIQIPENVLMDKGTLFVEVIAENRLRFTYRSEQATSQ